MERGFKRVAGTGWGVGVGGGGVVADRRHEHLPVDQRKGDWWNRGKRAAEGVCECVCGGGGWGGETGGRNTYPWIRGWGVGGGGGGLVERDFKRVAGTGVVGVEWGKTDARNTYPGSEEGGLVEEGEAGS